MTKLVLNGQTVFESEKPVDVRTEKKPVYDGMGQTHLYDLLTVTINIPSQGDAAVHHRGPTDQPV